MQYLKPKRAQEIVTHHFSEKYPLDKKNLISLFKKIPCSFEESEIKCIGNHYNCLTKSQHLIAIYAINYLLETEKHPAFYLARPQLRTFLIENFYQFIRSHPQENLANMKIDQMADIFRDTFQKNKAKIFLDPDYFQEKMKEKFMILKVVTKKKPKIDISSEKESFIKKKKTPRLILSTNNFSQKNVGKSGEKYELKLPPLSPILPENKSLSPDDLAKNEIAYSLFFSEAEETLKENIAGYHKKISYSWFKRLFLGIGRLFSAKKRRMQVTTIQQQLNNINNSLNQLSDYMTLLTTLTDIKSEITGRESELRRYLQSYFEQTLAHNQSRLTDWLKNNLFIPSEVLQNLLLLPPAAFAKVFGQDILQKEISNKLLNQGDVALLFEVMNKKDIDFALEIYENLNDSLINLNIYSSEEKLSIIVQAIKQLDEFPPHQSTKEKHNAIRLQLLRTGYEIIEAQLPVIALNEQSTKEENETALAQFKTMQHFLSKELVNYLYQQLLKESKSNCTEILSIHEKIKNKIKENFKACFALPDQFKAFVNGEMNIDFGSITTQDVQKSLFFYVERFNIYSSSWIMTNEYRKAKTDFLVNLQRRIHTIDLETSNGEQTNFDQMILTIKQVRKLLKEMTLSGWDKEILENQICYHTVETLTEKALFLFLQIVLNKEMVASSKQKKKAKKYLQKMLNGKGWIHYKEINIYPIHLKMRS